MSAAARRRDLLILGAAAALLILPGLGARDLWNPDEARYAEVAREMRQSGEWLVPQLNGAVYTQKPPLFFWAIDLAARATGGSYELAARLPSALGAIGAVLLVYLMGERLFGRRAGWIAAAAFATCAKVLWQARFGQIDMLFTALVALAVWCWVRSELPGDGAEPVSGQAGQGRAGRPIPYLFFVFTGLATLAKGPAGLLPPLLAIVAFRLLTRGPRGLRGLRLGRGMLLWAAVVLAWLVPAGLDGGPDYLRQILLKQNVTRYADPWHHVQPWYYYLTVLPVDFFPWSFLLPPTLVVGWRRGWLGRRIAPGFLPLSHVGEGPPFLFSACWVVVTILFFSVSPAKRTVYVLTMYPGLALLLGAGLDRLVADWPRERRWLLWPLGLLAGLGVLLVAAVAIAGPGRQEAALLGGTSFVWKLAGALGLLAAGAVAAWWLAWRNRPLRAIAALAAGTAGLGLAAALFLVPAFDVVKSARPLSRRLLAEAAPGEPYGIYPRLDSTFLFYTGRFAVPLESEEELRRFAARPGRVWVLAQRDDLAKLDGPLPLVEVARDPDQESGYLLLRSR